MNQAWQCEVCEGINSGGTTCATCGAVIPPGATPTPAPTVASTPAPPPAPSRPRSEPRAPGPSTRPPLGPRAPALRSRPARPGARRPPAPSPPSPAPPRPAVAASRPAPPSAAPRPAPPSAAPRPPSSLVGVLARVVLLLGWLLSASYAPGLAPRLIEGLAVGERLALRTDGEDTLVLVDEDTEVGDQPIRIDFPDGGAGLEVGRRSQTVWVVQRDGEAALTTIAGRAGGERVVRVPGRPPGGRWAAEVAGERVPAEGTLGVEVAGPPPLTDWRVLLAGGVLTVLVAWRAARSATVASLRRDARALLFGVLLLSGAPVAARLLGRAVAAAGWSATYPTAEPALVWVAMALAVPLLALRLSAATTTGRSGAARELRGGGRGAAAALAGGLVVVAVLLGQVVVRRYLPGLAG